MKIVGLSLVFATFAISANAQISQIGPFVGSASENFESHPSTANAGAVPGGLFGGTATLTTPSGAGVYITGGWGFTCSLSAMGSRMCGTGGGTGGMGIDIAFTTPPAKFGGYFGMNHPGAADINVSFYAGATLVSGPTVTVLPVNCTWNWLGWDLAGSGVDRIHIKSNYSSTGYVHMDDLEVDYTTCVIEYGQGCFGSLGLVPHVSAPSCAVGGGSATIVVSNALGGANAIMFLGATQAAASMGAGCFLNVAPLFPIQLNFPLNGVGPGNGGISIVSGVPAAASGVTVTLQVFVVDPGGVGGYANTNGLELQIQ